MMLGLMVSLAVTWICWRIIYCLLTNFCEMSVFRSYWWARYSTVSEQTCTIDHKNGPKRVTNDYLVWSLTFIIHVFTNNIVMWETLQNKADWDCFKTPILQDILRIQQSTSSGLWCIFGSHTFVPISWMCKKQTSVSHSSTESEIMSLDASLRMDGISALDLWNLV